MLVTLLLTDVAGVLASTVAINVARSRLWVLVNVGVNHTVAGSLVLLFKFKEVVESQVSAAVSNGAVVNVGPIMTLGATQFSLLPPHWKVQEHITDPLGS